MGRKAFILVIWGIAIWFLSCSSEAAGIEDELPPAYLEVASVELELASLVNSYRDSKGLIALQKLDEISRQAFLHNEHMIEAGELCHHNFGKRYQALSRSIGAMAMGENVGYGYRTADAFLAAWIKSPQHQKILIQDFTHFGISSQLANENLYVTLILVKR